MFQVQKFSVNKEYTKALYESFGDFYQVRVVPYASKVKLHSQEGMEMPEPPKQGFFKGFFGGGAKPATTTAAPAASGSLGGFGFGGATTTTAGSTPAFGGFGSAVMIPSLSLVA